MLQIICEEFVWLSSGVMACIHSRGSFSAKGLVLNSTTVDPNWSGQMAFALYNFSDLDIELIIGDRFATMVCYYCNSSTSESPISRAVEGVQNTAFSIYEHSPEISMYKSRFEEKKNKAQKNLFYVFKGIKQKFLLKLHRNLEFRSVIIFLFFVSSIALIALPAGVYSMLQSQFG